MQVNRIRHELNLVRAAQPGTRFEAGHERHRIHNHALRMLVIGIGCVLMVSAAATFWMPGPNFVVVLASLVLVAGQWRAVARRLDRGEVVARRWHGERWIPLPRWRKRLAVFAMWLAGACVAVMLTYVSWRTGALPVSLPILGSLD